MHVARHPVPAAGSHEEEMGRAHKSTVDKHSRKLTTVADQEAQNMPRTAATCAAQRDIAAGHTH